MGEAVRNRTWGCWGAGLWALADHAKRRSSADSQDLVVSGIIALLSRAPSPEPRSPFRSLPTAMLWLIGVASAAHSAEHTFIISGLGGEPAYEARFREQANTLAEFARKASGVDAVTVLTGAEATRDAVRRSFGELAERIREDDAVTIMLIGHGSFDGEEYRLNLPGPDLTGAELGVLFDRLPARQQLIVNATSASGAVVDHWQREHRVVVTATKNGGERTATRFAHHWAQAVTTTAADVNKDDLVTAAEAFDYATREVQAAFKADVSLATEHGRLEGENASAFAVARFGAARASSGDAQVATLLTQRGALELQLNAVKQRKSLVAEDAYYDELEGVLVELAMLQRRIDERQAEIGGGGE